MAKMFKMEKGKAEQFFSGKTVVIKKNLNQETAEKYQKAIHKAGGRCWISFGESQPPPEQKISPPPEIEQQTDSGFEQKPVHEDEPLPPRQAETYPAVISNLKNQMTSEQVKRGKLLGRHAIGQAREVSNNVFHALKVLLTDPIGGQSESLRYFEKSKAVSAGIVFICFFIISAFLVERAHFASLNEMASMFGGGMAIGPGDYAKMMLLNLVPPMALCLSFYVINKMAGELPSSFHAYIYTAGVVLIPSGITLLVFWILGYGNLEFVGLVAFFGIAITILMVNSSLLDVYLISTRKAVLLTPTVVLVTAYVSKLLFTALIQRF